MDATNNNPTIAQRLRLEQISKAIIVAPRVEEAIYLLTADKWWRGPSRHEGRFAIFKAPANFCERVLSGVFVLDIGSYIVFFVSNQPQDLLDRGITFSKWNI